MSADRSSGVAASPHRNAPARWRIAASPSPAEVAVLAGELSLPRDLCQLLAVRGYNTPEKAKPYLRPRVEQLHPGATMLGMDRAVDRLQRAIRGGERILVHGDYDVDGMCSSTLMTRVMRQLGGDVQPFIPHRVQDGYDLGEAGVRAAIESKASVVLTCDCGTSAVEAVASLRSHGIDVIISDHHLPGSGAVPECTAVLNPRQPGCPYPDKDLAAVGVAFKLATELVRSMDGDEQQVLRLLDLVALATIADIAPLRGENRVFARIGLRLMRDSSVTGLRSLIRAAGLRDKRMTAGRVGFTLAPRLNAVGRIGRALRGVELLLNETEHEANAIARELEELNRERQELDRSTLASARELLANVDWDETYGLVLGADGWHPGVIGIVASRVVEETGRPAVLVALEDGMGKGSGRSIPAFDLHGALGDCADLLERYGGHRLAAGVTLRADRLPEFAKRFNAVARAALKPEDLIPDINIDMELQLDADTDRLSELIRHMEPFGVGNPGPVFLARNLEVRSNARKVGESGLKFHVHSGQGAFEVIGWDLARRRERVSAGERIDLVFRLERDDWNGVERLQLRALDLRDSAAGGEVFLRSAEGSGRASRRSA